MLIDIATSLPPFRVTQAKAALELKKKMADRPAIGRLIDTAAYHSGIENRYIVIPDGDDNIKEKFYSNAYSPIKPGTKIRMDEYEKWAKKLSADAFESLLRRNDFDPAIINRIITVSCTGFFAPGLDHYLMKRFNIPFSAKRTNIGFMGCAASITAFTSALEAMNSQKNSDELNVLILSVELCSLHLQTEPSRDNILSNIIFADGCAAALFSNSEKLSISTNNKSRLKLVETNTILFDNSAEYMGWKIGNFGFEMILSPELPNLILEYAVPALKELLLKKGISKDSVKHWALHPGGRAILDAIQMGMKLSDEMMESSRYILKNYGNMSSATILYVIKHILDTQYIEKDEWLVALAFGPGLTMEVALFKGQ
ncbi:MAG: type III polyketide synthase [Bacteroidota bacterium]|nr:type III polyketide synthase [Bacteroidota bacterium]MDP4190012.1 type III polyketide synthase [Bacteroidota bacterium]MDP4193444.1 type III polyketide synthase [Bacteroidota bacterium]